MTTALDLVNETRNMVMASTRQELNRLTGSITNSAATLTFDFAAGSVATGAMLAIDLELIYVWSVTGSTATVQRGMRGSTPAAHSAGALITVNPTVSDYQIFTELNNDLTSLSAQTNGLYQVKTLATTATVASTYDFAADVTDVLSVQWNDFGPSRDWPRIRRWDVLYNQDTSVFPSGVALQLYAPPIPGRTLRVTYAAAFSRLAALTDDVQATSGLPATANDIPPLGAAGRILAAREARRSSVDAQPESRQAQDVPPGTARNSAAQLFALRAQRINEEASRLTSSWPTVMRPAV